MSFIQKNIKYRPSPFKKDHIWANYNLGDGNEILLEFKDGISNAKKYAIETIKEKFAKYASGK